MAGFPLLDALAVRPRWQQLVLGLVVLAVFAGAGYFIAVLPVHGRVQALRVQRDTQSEELARLRTQAQELARTRREAAEVAQQLEIVKEKLPTQREIPALYRTLSDAAVQAGLAVALFQPLPPRLRDFYSEIPISLVAEGGYHDIGDFLARVAALPRATSVSDLKLAAPKPEAGPASGARPPTGANRPRPTTTDASKPRRSIRAEITLLTFVYRPVGSPPAPKPATGAAKSEAPKP